MAQICFYIDEDAMRSSFVEALRNTGLDVVTVADVSRLGCADADQLVWAAEQSRVLYSFNVKDFSALHNQILTQGNCHAGIVVVPRQRYSIGEQLRGIINLTNRFSAEEMVNQLIYLSNYIND